MQQIFHKTIGGTSLQFNRLLYPLKYQVKKDNLIEDGTIYELVGQENGSWKTDKELPKWFEEIFERVCEAINSNEQQ
ncbi:hypothetical protein [Segetibacter aerophilus]|uniref:Uncharacterized protein n=1 Tax=Segetibacter aerophilus TaxID=670293 RepID=A0A512BJE4_9BACT|nr:hypothetical protein [Segetibacter aerophilus]GEO12091.1 hypothetical protein SAE01_45870 [Segetibacter aerophilus]